MAPIGNPAIPPGSLVLVTGATGYIASHIVNQFLLAGYKVRGTVRDANKSVWLDEYFNNKYGKGKFETSIVADMKEPGAFDEAVKGVSGIVHVASVLTFSPNPHTVISPTVAGALSVLAAAAATPSVKRVVYTSSSSACLTPKPNTPFIVTSDTWNQGAIEDAWKPPPYKPERKWQVYGASKTQAEMECWKFMRAEKRGFVFNAVLPNANFGPVLSSEQCGSTGAWATLIYKGKLDALKDMPPQWFVDVRDDARLHVAALTHPKVENERIFAFAEPYNWNDILAIMRKLYPKKDFGDDIEDCGRDLSTLPERERAEGLLKEMGREGWTGLEESVRDNLAGVA